jgi:hypothetical protein
MSTALLRPDFGVLIDGVCMFRSKEKAPRYHGPHPKDELIQKLTWTYDPAPYILGQCVPYPSLLDQFSFTQVIMPSEPSLCSQPFHNLFLHRGQEVLEAVVCVLQTLKVCQYALQPELLQVDWLFRSCMPIQGHCFTMTYIGQMSFGMPARAQNGFLLTGMMFLQPQPSQQCIWIGTPIHQWCSRTTMVQRLIFGVPGSLELMQLCFHQISPIMLQRNINVKCKINFHTTI